MPKPTGEINMDTKTYTNGYRTLSELLLESVLQSLNAAIVDNDEARFLLAYTDLTKFIAAHPAEVINR
jgi:hypothetical protein